MRPQPLKVRALGALALGPATVQELRTMLACDVESARHALAELASRKQVTVTGERRGRTGAPAQLWRRLQ